MSLEELNEEMRKADMKKFSLGDIVSSIVDIKTELMIEKLFNTEEYQKYRSDSETCLINLYTELAKREERYNKREKHKIDFLK